MNGPDRIVVPEFRQALEHGAARFGFNEVEAQQLADRRIGMRAVDNAAQEAEAVIGFEHVRRDDAVILPLTMPPSWLRSPMHSIVAEDGGEV